MSTPIKKVILVGASGNLGPHILSALLASSFTVTLLTRPTSTFPHPPSIPVLRASYKDLAALKTAFTGQDAVVCALGFEGYKDQLLMINAAKEAGVKRFVPSEFGDVPRGKWEAGNEWEELLKVKREVMEYLIEKTRQKEGEEEGMTWSAVACGIFFDWSLTTFPTLGFDLKKRTATLYDTGHTPISGTTIAAIGTSVAHILLNPSLFTNKFVKIASLVTTQCDMLATFESITGQKWEVQHMGTKDVLERGKAKLAMGDFVEGFLDILIVHLFEKGVEGREVTTVQGSDNEAVGVEGEDLETVLRKCLETVGRAE
ncbi:NAD(P)-binding protein [Lepidopterella palustris CBS 459.81]|uniref:NAD(P)-binding protein n=1 Tax=Lepidopterella palustris CBS 459.81 TaxID=1314670 RepID=A0A8E2EHB0_9PEZI|nr:NAD(P)-binding protein [Lepidopterella palustris CBS 459.81]